MIHATVARLNRAGEPKRREGGRLRSPLHGEPFRLGGGPLTSMASLFATTSASAANLSRGPATRKRRREVDLGSSAEIRQRGCLSA